MGFWGLDAATPPLPTRKTETSLNDNSLEGSATEIA